MGSKRKRVNLSKSKFVAGLQCLKRLYLQCYERQLMPEIDEATQAIFDRGNEVGQLAQKAFPGGALVAEAYWDHERAIGHTRKLMADPNVPAVFEGAFTHDNVGIRADVLQRLDGGRWRLVEVKSGTGVKDVHVPDVAIQTHVLTGCGVDVAQSCLMHLDRSYVYEGGEYDLDRLFHIEDMAESLAAFAADLPQHLARQQGVLTRDTPPDIEPGPQCTDPYECEFYAHCNPELPEHHVSTLYRVSTRQMEAFEEAGIETIHQIPDEAPLSELQQRMRRCIATGDTFIDKKAVRKTLAGLSYPLYFMDFETVNPALPRYPGLWPYGQFPFQWSIHIRESPGAEAEHLEFLVEDASDPREPFLSSLLEALNSRGEGGDIVVYNKGFESACLGELAGRFPERAGAIEQVRRRLWDLLPVIRKHVYDPGFHGSLSIKSVLPALTGGEGYEEQAVADGTEAALAYERMIRQETPEMECQWLRASLLEYCKLDTLAMVRLIERLALNRP